MLTEASLFHQLDSRASVFLTYQSVYEHDADYLETLYIGRNFISDSLHQRIKRLARFIPRIEGLFVKKNGNEYYLISQFEKGVEAAEQADELCINYKLYESIKETEGKLSEMVSTRFSELKKLIKSGIPKQTDRIVPKSSEEDTGLSLIINQLLKIHPIEEIYLFHKKQSSQSTIYYLLLIGKGLGIEILNDMQQSAMAKSGGKCVVVLIGHSRIWIQTNLFIHQSFFQKIMGPENIIFQSHQNHPSIHWETPYTPDYSDLEFYYRSTNELVANYFVLRRSLEKGNMEGIGDWFSKSVLRILNTLVLSKLTYLPHYQSGFNLWKLCVYADPKLEHVEFLFEKLSGENFFKELP